MECNSEGMRKHTAVAMRHRESWLRQTSTPKHTAVLLAVVDSTVIIYDYYYSAIVVVVSFVFPFLSESLQLELRLMLLCHTAADGHII